LTLAVNFLLEQGVIIGRKIAVIADFSDKEKGIGIKRPDIWGFQILNGNRETVNGTIRS